MLVGEGCDGRDCSHYRIRCRVGRSKDSGFLPLFDLPPDEFCSHPSIFKAKKGLEYSVHDPCGIILSSIKKCPKW
jgi:hypothetical protein